MEIVRDRGKSQFTEAQRAVGRVKQLVAAVCSSMATVRSLKAGLLSSTYLTRSV